MKYSIVDDCDPISPREFCNLGKIVYVSWRYKLGDEKVSNEQLEEIMNDKNNIVLPVYAYIHGGVSLNTTGFSCIFDSGVCGCIYVSKEDVRKEFDKKVISKKLREQVEGILRSEVELYSKYLSGECYGYQIYDEGEIVDSCYGYFSVSEAEEQAKDSLNYLLSKKEVQLEMFA